MNGRFVLAAVVALLAAAGGWWAGRQSAPLPVATEASAPAERTILYYRNPMGLPDTSPVPKKDSMGMDYVPVYAGEAPATSGTVVVSPERVQTTGVRVDAVRSAPWMAALRFPAVLALDEARQRVIAPRFEGWVQRLAADQTGKAFRRGDLLLTAYSPEYLAAQQEYLVALRAQQSLGDAPAAAHMDELARAALQRLRNFGVGESGIERLRRGEVQRELAIVAPIDGVITARPVLAGARFMAGETVLEMADYSQLWAVAQVPASASAQIAVGQRARFRSEALPDRASAARSRCWRPRWIRRPAPSPCAWPWPTRMACCVRSSTARWSSIPALRRRCCRSRVLRCSTAACVSACSSNSPPAASEPREGARRPPRGRLDRDPGRPGRRRAHRRRREFPDRCGEPVGRGAGRGGSAARRVRS